jgi:hypothetical protein
MRNFDLYENPQNIERQGVAGKILKRKELAHGLRRNFAGGAVSLTANHDNIYYSTMLGFCERAPGGSALWNSELGTMKISCLTMARPVLCCFPPRPTERKTYGLISNTFVGVTGVCAGDLEFAIHEEFTIL